MPNGARMRMMSRKILNTPIDGNRAQARRQKKGSRGNAPCGVQRRRLWWGLGQRPNCFSGAHSKRTANKGAGSEASLPVTKKPCNTVQVTWEATAEGVQRAIGKPSGSCSFYHYNRKVNSGSAKSSLTFYCCRGISRLRARPKGMKTNEVCDRPLETFGCTLPYLYWRVAYFYGYKTLSAQYLSMIIRFSRQKAPISFFAR